jgi:hypothetical protein
MTLSILNNQLTFRSGMTDAEYKYYDENKLPFNMQEANASRGGGNTIKWRDTDWHNFEVVLENEEFSTYITHKTARMLLQSILGSSNAEYFLYHHLKDNFDELHYPTVWSNLGVEKEWNKHNVKQTEKETV